jgi:hypothetical protein
MPNKSDTAWKIHEYLSYVAFKAIYWINWFSPYDVDKKLEFELFSAEENKNLHECSTITASLMAKQISNLYPWDTPVQIEHTAGTLDNDFDTDDLMVTLKSWVKVGFSLKCSSVTMSKLGENTCLSKNMWAQSLLTKYFWSLEAQEIFNEYYRVELLKFLNSIFKTNFPHISGVIKYIKQKSIDDWYEKDRFEYYPNANINRNIFLPKLRDKLYELISSLSLECILRAANIIKDSWNNNIIFATYKTGHVGAILFCNMPLTEDDFCGIKIRDNRSCTLIFSTYEIGFRYKFESSITSPIKLVWDYSPVYVISK